MMWVGANPVPCFIILGVFFVLGMMRGSASLCGATIALAPFVAVLASAP